MFVVRSVATMGRITWRVHQCPSRFGSWVQDRRAWCKLLHQTLFSNEFNSMNMAFDTAMEPMFWCVDHFAKYMGPIMVTLVVFLTTMVAAIFYVCLLPHIYFQSKMATVFHLIFGHWLLMMIVFNYVMACFTKPGHPPEKVQEIVSICKKCISPKPPRTHHCTVCQNCVLKMDHHCPWLNNCVGFYNHRYFFMFCAYMWTGTIYVSAVGYELFKQHFYGNKEIVFPGVFFPLNLFWGLIQNKATERPPTVTSHSENDFDPDDFEMEPDLKGQWIHNAVVFEFVLSTGVCIALGLLTVWHARMISRGETSIEVHINKKERKRLKTKGLMFKNPYDMGFVKNWKAFLGIDKKGRSFWRHILLPSCHPPDGTGLTWKTATYQLKYTENNGLRLL